MLVENDWDWNRVSNSESKAFSFVRCYMLKEFFGLTEFPELASKNSMCSSQFIWNLLGSLLSSFKQLTSPAKHNMQKISVFPPVTNSFRSVQCFFTLKTDSKWAIDIYLGFVEPFHVRLERKGPGVRSITFYKKYFSDEDREKWHP